MPKNHSKTPKSARVRARRIWGIRPSTKIIPDKRRIPARKRKHKIRAGED